jgi:hypothetical protein
MTHDWMYRKRMKQYFRAPADQERPRVAVNGVTERCAVGLARGGQEDLFVGV